MQNYAQVATAPAVERESVSVVLGHTGNLLDDVEKRLYGLRDRIQLANDISADKAPTPVSGMLSHALDLRNRAQRVKILVESIEGLL